VGDGIISAEQFRPFCQHNKVLLMPLFAVQDKLRAAAMGRPFWKAMSERHVTLTSNRRVSLANLMNEVSVPSVFLLALSFYSSIILLASGGV
jgi:hypothetical protein